MRDAEKEMKTMDHFFEIAGRFDAIMGLASTVFAALAWLKARQVQRAQIEEEKRRAAPIQITLVAGDGRELRLPYRPRRDQLSRSEVAGVLGMYAGRRRYDLPGLSVAYESGHFGEVASGLTDEFRIQEVSGEEFDSFSKDLAELELARHRGQG